MKFKKFPDGRIFIQFKFNPSEHLLSTPDDIAAADPDGGGDDLVFLMEAVISIVDTEVKTIVIDPGASELSITTKKKLRKTKTKSMKFNNIKQIRIVQKKKRNAIFLETHEDEKELIVLHKSQRKINRIFREIEETIGA